MTFLDYMFSFLISRYMENAKEHPVKYKTWFTQRITVGDTVQVLNFIF